MRINSVWPAALIFLLLTSCVSLENLAVKKAAGMLSGESAGSVFAGDEDPELVKDALPPLMKLYETLLVSLPEDADLNAATGRNFIMYANAFLQTPAGMLPDEEYLQAFSMLGRAKKMYLRGRNYILQSMEITHPGFREKLHGENIDDLLMLFSRPEDASLLYWSASAWIAAFSCDPFDFELASELYIPVALLLRGLELDPGYNRGAIHDVLIQIYASLPSSHLEKARARSPEVLAPFIEKYYGNNRVDSSREARTAFHYKTALQFSRGSNPATHIAYAQGICVPAQDSETYTQVLSKALEINPNHYPENRLAILIYQEKARWLLAHIEDFFLMDTDSENTNDEEIN